MAITSFSCKETEKLFHGQHTQKFPSELRRNMQRKLRRIHTAKVVNELSIPPGNRLKKLKEDLQDFYSLRINDQWRIIFKFENEKAFEVRIMDYH